MKVVIVGWEPGFAKVSFNKFLRTYLGYSIHDAKLCVDEILAGSSVEISYEGDAKDKFLEELSNFDLVFNIQDS